MAKRVNVQFLTILTAVVVGIAVVLGFSPKIISHFLHHNPKHWIALGDADAAKHNWPAAVNEYGQALQLDETNKAVCVQLGDALNHLTSVDPKNLSNASNAWRKALEIDPQYAPALQRLMDMDQQLVELAPSNQPFYADLRKVAGQLAVADPSNAAAKAEVNLATVQQWLASGPVSDKELQTSLAALQGMLKKDPGNADLVFYLGRAYVAQGAKALKQGQSSDVVDDFDRRARAVVDAALAAKPKDADLNFRAFQVYGVLAGSAHLTEVRSAAAKSQAGAILDAYANATPQDALYSQIVELYARWEVGHGQKDQAEAALRKYNEQVPGDLQMRAFFASKLASFGKRDEAIALLSQPVSNAMESGPRGQLQRQNEFMILLTLTGLQIDKSQTIHDSAERQKQMAQIDAQLAQLMSTAPDNPQVLRMKGFVEAVKGQRYKAIETLSRAKQLLEATDRRDVDTYFGVLFQLGTAYMNEGQDVSAEKAFEQAAQLRPDFIEVRHDLAELYLRGRNPDQAAVQIAAIAKADPKDPSLGGLRLAYDQLAHTNTAAEDYQSLPETTHDQRLAKARAAASLGDDKDCIRLLKLALQEKPNDPQVSLALAGALAHAGDKDGAIALLTAQQKLSPNDNTIALVLDELNNAPADQVARIQKSIEASTPPFIQAMRKYADDFNNHKYDAALLDLKEAERAGGNDKLVTEQYFQLFLTRQQYDDAASVISTLARLNADDAGGLTYQIRLAMAQNHRDEAIRYAEQLTHNQPELALSWVMLGDAYKANGQYDHALENYRQALDRQALNVGAFAGEIDCYLALHQLDLAQAAIAKGRQLFPDNLGLRNAELNYKMTYGNPDEVVAELQKNLAAAPNDPSSYQELVQACMIAAESRLAESGADGPRPLLEKAHDALAQALTKWPDDERFVPIMAQVEQRLGDYPGALKLLTDFAALPNWKNRIEPELFLADLYSRAGKAKETESTLRAAWSLNKNDVGVQLKLAEFLGSIGKFDDALAVLTDRSDPAVARERLQLLMQAGRYAEAETGLQSALAKAPSNVDLLLLLAELHTATGHFQDAQADVTHGLSIDPKNVALLLQSARIEMARPHGDLDLANRQLNALLAVQANNFDAQVLLSDLYVAKHQLDAAISALELALKMQPLNKPVRVQLAHLYGTTSPPEWTKFDALLHTAETNPQLNVDPTWLALEAGGLFQRNQVSDALAKMRQAQSMAPDNMGLEQGYLEMLLQAKQYSDALAEIDRVLASGKRFYWLHEMRGLALVQQGHKPQALQEFQAALTQLDADNQRDLAAKVIATIGEQIDPDTALTVLQPRIGIGPAWRLLAVRLYEAKGDFASAMKTAEQVAADPLASSSERLAATENVANCASQQGQFDKAKTAYLSWIDQSPNDYIALNNLACLLNDNLHQPQEALQYSKRAYELAGKAGPTISPAITDTHGWVQVNCGGDAARSGRSLLEQLVQDHNEFVDGHYHLARAYMQAGMNDSAITQLTSALAQIKIHEANHQPISDELKKNINQAMSQAKQAAAKAEAAVH